MTKKKDPIDSGSDIARKIWLAGVGAYGKAFSEAQEGLSKMTKGSGKMFDELAEKGEAIETMVKIKGKSVAKDTADKFGGGVDIDERITKMRARLKRSLGDQPDEDADDRADQLIRIEAKLDQVLALLQPAARKRAPATRKPAVKKTAAKIKAKPKPKA